MPAFLLKRQIMTNLPTEKLEVSVANSIDFMVERVRTHLLVSCSIVCIVLNRLHSLNNKDNTVGFLIGGGGMYHACALGIICTLTDKKQNVALFITFSSRLSTLLVICIPSYVLLLLQGPLMNLQPS